MVVVVFSIVFENQVEAAVAKVFLQAAFCPPHQAFCLQRLVCGRAARYFLGRLRVGGVGRDGRGESVHEGSFSGASALAFYVRVALARPTPWPRRGGSAFLSPALTTLLDRRRPRPRTNRFDRRRFQHVRATPQRWLALLFCRWQEIEISRRQSRDLATAPSVTYTQEAP